MDGLLPEQLISIHAPRTGSDEAAIRQQEKDAQISIHAPRTGSDYFSGAGTTTAIEFQSTLPARGAT